MLLQIQAPSVKDPSKVHTQWLPKYRQKEHAALAYDIANTWRLLRGVAGVTEQKVCDSGVALPVHAGCWRHLRRHRWNEGRFSQTQSIHCLRCSFLCAIALCLHTPPPSLPLFLGINPALLQAIPPTAHARSLLLCFCHATCVLPLSALQARFNFPQADYLGDKALCALLEPCNSFRDVKRVIKALLPPSTPPERSPRCDAGKVNAPRGRAGLASSCNAVMP